MSDFKQHVRESLEKLVPKEWFVTVHHDNGSARVTIWQRGGGTTCVLGVGRTKINSIRSRREHAERVVEILRQADFPCDRKIVNALKRWKPGRTLVTADWDK